MSHGGSGARKAPEKCHVLFEWLQRLFILFRIAFKKEVNKLGLKGTLVENHWFNARKFTMGDHVVGVFLDF